MENTSTPTRPRRSPSSSNHTPRAPLCPSRMSSSPPLIGCCFLTAYGPAVVVSVSAASADPSTQSPQQQQYPQQQHFKCRLWRAPFKSIASSSVAFLREEDFLRPLPATPGMAVRLLPDAAASAAAATSAAAAGGDVAVPAIETPLVMVHQYLSVSDEYMVSDYSPSLPSPPSVALYTVPRSAVSLQKTSSKFYPVIEALMHRSEVASKSAAPAVRRALRRASLKGASLASSLASSLGPGGVDELPSIAKCCADSLVSTSAEALEGAKVGDLVKVLRDDDLLTLLAKSRQRLQELLGGEMPESAKAALSSSGIEIIVSRASGFRNRPTSASASASASDSDPPVSPDANWNRRAALDAINDFLRDGEGGEPVLEGADAERLVREHWGQVVATLGEAGLTDEALNGWVSDFSSKTRELQELSGRLIETKSVAALFAGAERLKKRTGALLDPGKLSVLQASAAKILTRLTEGDEAIARIKGLELGNSVKSRLVAALEVRTAAKGGLDGIIEAALTSFESRAEGVDAEVAKLLDSVRGSATSSSLDVNEALLSTLSQKSVYRDRVLLGIEASMVGMEQQLSETFGGTLTAEDILKVASGEKGTATLFAPVAKRASDELQKQLDVAESNLENPTALAALKYVRQLLKGDLGINDAFDDAGSFLNNDSTVAAGESVILKGERMLDMLEGVAKQDHFKAVVEVMRKAGLTEDAIIEKLGSLDVNELMITAESAMNDSKSRQKLLASSTDSALDFLLRILPSMPVPPLDGVKDGTAFTVNNISLQGFKLRKEDIFVSIAGYSATSNEGFEGGGGPSKSAAPPTSQAPLLIKVKNIQAEIKNVQWSFEQTFFPYAKGKGEADATIVDADLMLQFELRRKKKKSNGSSGDAILQEFEPVLCLHDRKCSIEQLGLKLKGDSFSWLYNWLAAVFKTLLRDYVVKAVLEAISSSSGHLLQALNGNVSPYWPLILSMNNMKIEDLEEVDETTITDATQLGNFNIVELVWREHLPLGMQLLMNDGSGEIRIVEFPRGGQARRVAEAASHDPDIFRGATICSVNGKKMGGRSFPKPTATVLKSAEEVNEARVQSILAALKDPARPKAVEFELNETEGEKIMKAMGMGEMSDEQKEERERMVRKAKKELINVVIAEKGPLGLSFGVDDELGLVLIEVKSDSPHKSNPNVKLGNVLVSINSVVVLSKTECVTKASTLFKDIGDSRPLTLAFAEPATVRKTFEYVNQMNTSLSSDLIKGGEEHMFFGCPSSELELSELRQEGANGAPTSVVVSGFKEVPGPIEAGGAHVGDILVNVNGSPFGMPSVDAGAAASTRRRSASDAFSMFGDDKSYPMVFEFARMKPGPGGEGDDEFSERHCIRYLIEVPRKSDLGVSFQKRMKAKKSVFSGLGKKSSKAGDAPELDRVMVSSFRGVVGPARQHMVGNNVEGRDMVGVGMRVLKINGYFVPQTAEGSDVVGALRRGWTDQGKSVDVSFKDLEQEAWLESLIR